MSEQEDSKGARKRWESPIFITVLTALIGILGTGAGAVFQGYYDAALEKQKFESSLIFKALEPEDAQERAKYLLFLADSGLIQSLDVEQIRKIASDPKSIPGSNPKLALGTARDILSIDYSVPGEIAIDDENVWKTWAQDDIIFAASRVYGQNLGKVLAFGHDDILKLAGNEADLKESFHWLSGTTVKRIGVATGHCEWVPTRYAEDGERLLETLRTWGYEVTTIDGPISAAALKNIGVLIVGNAWGSFTEQEIRRVEKFVADGGGLMTAGLGWSWQEYGLLDSHKCTGNVDGQVARDLTTYPMNRLMKKFGARWTDTYIQ